MSQENTSSPSVGPMLLLFLAGATVGAVLVALTTPKTGPELRGDLKDLARRAKWTAEALAEDASGAWDDVKECTALATGELKHGMSDGA